MKNYYTAVITISYALKVYNIFLMQFLKYILQANKHFFLHALFKSSS